LFFIELNITEIKGVFINIDMIFIRSEIVTTTIG